MFGKPLAYVVKVRNLREIPGADRIELATVLDYTVVVHKGEYKPGDLALYVEVDSKLPDGLSPDDLERYRAIKDGSYFKGIVPTDEEVQAELERIASSSKYPYFEFLRSKGLKVKNMKLSKFGVVSQGILFRPETVGLQDVEEGQDYTEHFGIRETVEDPEEAGVNVSKEKPRSRVFEWIERNVLSKFGFYRRWCRVHRVQEVWADTFPEKSDEVNVQHVYSEMFEKYKDKDWIATEKLEGQNISIYTELVPSVLGLSKQKRVGVCSRNRELSPKGDMKEMWDTVRRLGLDERIKAIPGEWWCRGEHLGPNIQNNIYRLTETDIVFFDFYRKEYDRTDCKKFTWVKLGFEESVKFAKENGLKFVPVLDDKFKLPEPGVNDKGVTVSGVDKLLKLSDGKTVFGNNRNHRREGIVLRLKEDYTVSFKVKNPNYSIKERQ